MLAVDHEGKQVAEWLNSLGVAAFVLKYRLGPALSSSRDAPRRRPGDPDGPRRCGPVGLDPHKIAIIGFSAGGHLASTAGTHFDAGKPDDEDPIERVSSRPDRLILVYPVIALATPYGHSGRSQPAGRPPDARAGREPSNERQVTKDTPPTFLAHTNADKGVPPRTACCSPWRAQGRRAGRAAPFERGNMVSGWGVERPSSRSRLTRRFRCGRSFARPGSRIRVFSTRRQRQSEPAGHFRCCVPGCPRGDSDVSRQLSAHRQKWSVKEDTLEDRS